MRKADRVLQMGLRHPGWFYAIGDFSGDDRPWVHGGVRQLFFARSNAELARAERTYDPRALFARAHGNAGNEPAIIFSSGRSDHVLVKMERLFAQARRDHITAALDIYPGGHTFRLWSESFARTLPWVMRDLGDARVVRTVTARGRTRRLRMHALAGGVEHVLHDAPEFSRAPGFGLLEIDLGIFDRALEYVQTIAN